MYIFYSYHFGSAYLFPLHPFPFFFRFWGWGWGVKRGVEVSAGFF